MSDMRHVMVDWTDPGGCWYVVELREEGGPWSPAIKSPRLGHPVRFAVRPGLQYVVRVAAFNHLGSRGFSQPSNTILLHLGESPPPQRRLLSLRNMSALPCPFPSHIHTPNSTVHHVPARHMTGKYRYSYVRNPRIQRELPRAERLDDPRHRENIYIYLVRRLIAPHNK